MGAFGCLRELSKETVSRAKLVRDEILDGMMWLLKPQCVGYRTKLVLYPLCVGNSQASSVCHSFFIHSSLRPFIHAVAIRSSLSFNHHLFLLELNTFFWIRTRLTLSMATFVAVFGWISRPCSASEGNVQRLCTVTLNFFGHP